MKNVNNFQISKVQPQGVAQHLPAWFFCQFQSSIAYEKKSVYLNSTARTSSPTKLPKCLEQFLWEIISANGCSKSTIETIEKPKPHWHGYDIFPAGIYMFKVKNRNTRRCEICSKLKNKVTRKKKDSKTQLMTTIFKPLKNTFHEICVLGVNIRYKGTFFWLSSFCDHEIVQNDKNEHL